MDLRDELNLAFIYMGVLVGAGFASGREIISFFTVYGGRGLMGIALACSLFFIIGYTVLRLSISCQSTSIKDVLLPYSGEKLMVLFEGITFCFLLGGYYIMLAGCCAVLWECAGLPYLPTAAVLSLLCSTWLMRGSGGLAGFNAVLVPTMTMLTILICYLSLRGSSGIALAQFPARSSGNWFVSSILYVSFNTAFASVVIAALGNYTPRVSAAFGAALIASLGLFVLAAMLWLTTSVEYPKLYAAQIPLLDLASPLGAGFYWGAVVVLLSAMLTTALSLGYAFAQGISRRVRIRYNYALVGLFIGWPFTAYGFSRMIETVYPLFGVIGIFFAFMMLIRRFFCFKIE